MYRVVISQDEERIVLRPEVEAEDAIYWVNRLAALNLKVEVVREDEIRTIPNAQEAPLPVA